MLEPGLAVAPVLEVVSVPLELFVPVFIMVLLSVVVELSALSPQPIMVNAKAAENKTRFIHCLLVNNGKHGNGSKLFATIADIRGIQIGIYL